MIFFKNESKSICELKQCLNKFTSSSFPAIESYSAAVKAYYEEEFDIKAKNVFRKIMSMMSICRLYELVIKAQIQEKDLVKLDHNVYSKPVTNNRMYTTNY